ncbi:MAG: UvrD-helicase domain-containing protein [Flavobacteriales bacterium]|nr:UvrD-helicase domain-containing protein [Flavobacteriales bacterium]
MSNFVTYNSSAGSGKTYTLVKEYLKIALETKSPTQYKHILAVTFTNKAAAEMKERIIGALKALSSDEELTGTPKFLMDDLLKPKEDDGLGIDANEISDRSKKVLESILHSYNDFGVSTIDKFTHKIIRTFAHDLQLPLNFDIELDDREVLGAAIDLLIAEVGTNEKLTKLLLEYTSKKAEAEESWHIERDLFEFSKNLLKEDGELYLEKIRKLSIKDFDGIKTQLYQQTKEFEATVKQLGEDGLEFIRGKGVEPTSFSRSFFVNYWKDLATLKKFEPTPTTIKIINGEQNWYAAKVDDAQKQSIDASQNEFINQFNTSREYIDQFEGDYRVNKLIIKNLYNLAVLNEIEKTVLQFKKDNNVLSISDFNKRIAAIVESEPIPFIYERLGEKYNHYLIDEFQDTSVIQWHNLIPLIDNSLGTGKFNMVVGDAKQAIYRWRGGEVEQIINLPQVFKHNDNPLLLEREAALTRNYTEKTLTTNFRSKAEVVQFNNDFFQSVAGNLSEKYQKLYSDLSQEYDSNNTGGGVSVEFLEESDNELYRTSILNNTFNTIKQVCKDGFSLSDVAILTRSNNDGSEIATFLLENEINVISSESLLLNNSDEVTFLLSLFKYLSYPTDKHHQVQLLNYLTNRFNDDLFEVFETHKENTVITYLNSKDIYIDFKKIANYSLYELAEYFVVAFGFDTTVDVYIQFFLDKIHEYASRNDNSVLNFVEWWESKSEKFSIVIPEGIDAVRVMSIHKSKGLEFPVVIFPFATSSVKTSEKFFWTNDTNIEGLKSAIMPINESLTKTRFTSVYEDEMDKSRLDLVNVLYVALTRPKDRLYIISRTNKKPSKNGSATDYLYSFCESMPDSKVADHQYRFGLFADNTVQNKSTGNDIQFKSVSYNSWRDKIQISYQAPEVWDTENPETIGEYGTLIHNILSQINTKADIENALLKAVRKGLITEAELPSIKEEIEKLFNIEGVADLFLEGDEIINETSILLKNGDSLIPDRVVIKKDRVIIVDYKTGKEEKKHFKQLEEYKIRLSEMGYTNIESYLLYTNEGKLMSV